MQYKKGQVKILSNTHTGRETYVDLNDVVLFPATESEIKLGDYLDSLNKTGQGNTKEIKKIKKVIKDLTLMISRVNLK